MLSRWLAPLRAAAAAAPPDAAAPEAGPPPPPPPARPVEFAVRLSCGGCASTAARALSAVPGVHSASADLASQSATAVGTAPSEALLDALAAAGLDARLVGQGGGGGASTPSSHSLAAVAELKGDNPLGIVGVVRFWQGAASPSLSGPGPSGGSATAAVAEASLGCLAPGASHAVALHTFGDLTRGSCSAGPPLAGGALGVAVAGADGVARLGPLALPPGVRVADLVGRALVVYPAGHGGGGAAAAEVAGGAAAVVARAAAAGENRAKRTCACDGTVIFSAEDLMPRKRAPAAAAAAGAAAAAAP